MKRRYQLLIHFFMTLCVLGGGFLAAFLIARETGKFSHELAWAVVGGTLGGEAIFLVMAWWHKRKNGQIPVVDERSLLVLKNYFLITLYIVLVGSSALLLILYFLGVKSIETGAIIAYMAVLISFIMLGAILTKRFA
ncbi:hypothetical protein [Bacillus sp. 2205SS5-2]|uniref:hypothetical protein n=1 Tax=Bacillus sp. 2205SS5-2 TaxID=3109031 RepID=UPI0030044E6D